MRGSSHRAWDDAPQFAGAVAQFPVFCRKANPKQRQSASHYYPFRGVYAFAGGLSCLATTPFHFPQSPGKLQPLGWRETTGSLAPPPLALQQWRDHGGYARSGTFPPLVVLCDISISYVQSAEMCVQARQQPYHRPHLCMPAVALTGCRSSFTLQLLQLFCVCALGRCHDL